MICSLSFTYLFITSWLLLQIKYGHLYTSTTCVDVILHSVHGEIRFLSSVPRSFPHSPDHAAEQPNKVVLNISSINNVYPY